ncbi:MAG: hypothetical protein IPP18_03610 [Rhodocyclaceae bacterium]|nr:hypothetical protein [Rhodocyclaceae bacterium]
MNTAAVSSFTGSGEPGSNTLAYIAEPYRGLCRDDEDGDKGDVIIISESLTGVEDLLHNAGELN